MVRFLHTSDWQLGMTRHYLEGEAQARYTGARIDAIRNIAAVAAAQSCQFVVVAGDVFDSNLVGAPTVRRALEAMATVPCPVYLLPGNHDPLDAVTIYRSRVFETARPDNVVVLTEPGTVEVGEGVELVAAPWYSKAPRSDLVADAVAPLDPTDGVRIVVGHGAVDVLNPDDDDVASIRLADLRCAIDDGRIHYVALGDKHTRLAIGADGRIGYSGSPEVTSFREDMPGDVLVVDVEPGRRPVVTPHHIGTWQFVSVRRQIECGRDLDDLDEQLGALDPKDRTVVRTALEGTLSLSDKVRLDALLDAYGDSFAGRLTWGRFDDIAVVVADDELTDLGVGGFVGGAVQELAVKARAGTELDGDCAAARDALSLLYRLARGPAA